ncbi:MAG TPA: hypothetical protein VL547_18450, partial [Dinghuibacter sp.]|uniref:hypothetical protein n=1 Tax=Dinghuibacter sp. TaxID=2024697 RepID=UPI002C4F1381
MLTSLKRAFAVFLLLSSFTLCASAQKVFIQNVYPTFDTAGGTVTLYGRGFTNMRSLNFDNAQVAFNVLSDTVATAIAPVSCRNGIEATADDGSYSFLNFIVVPTPAQGEVYVSDFSPKYGHTGSIVTLRGRGFTGVSSVQMGGKPATSFTVVSDSVINVVANDTSIGWFEVDGTLPQANGFIPKGNVFINLDTYKDPYIISFSPRFATTGTKLTINGINFTGATGVVLPNGNPSSFTVVSPTQVVAVVGSGKTSLTTQLAVLTPNQQIYIYDSTAGPTMYPLATPVVTGFTPPSDTAGGLVTIT